MPMKLISLIFFEQREIISALPGKSQYTCDQISHYKYYFILKTSYNSFRDDYAAGFFIFAASS